MKTLTTLSRLVTGRVALITGAGSGIGRATVQLPAAEGVRVAVIDLNSAATESVVEEITTAGFIASSWTLDVVDAEACNRMVYEVADKFNQLDSCEQCQAGAPSASAG